MEKYPDDGLMARLESEFSTEEQGLFLQSFSAYLNHDPILMLTKVGDLAIVDKEAAIRADFEEVRAIIKKKSTTLGTISRMTTLELAEQKNVETRLRILEMETAMKERQVTSTLTLDACRSQYMAKAITQYDDAETKLRGDPHDKHLQSACTRRLEALRIITQNSAPCASITHDAPDEIKSTPTYTEQSEACDMSHFEPIPKSIDLRHARPVQIYNPNTLVFIKSFPAMATALAELGDDSKGSPSGIRKAIDTEHEYLGYRWLRVADGADPTVPVPINPTVGHVPTRPSLIAKLTLSKDRVVMVYSNLKLAAKEEHLKDSQSLSKAVHKGKMSRGHKWSLWDAVDPELQAKYLETRTLPLEFVRKGQAVIQLHPVTREVVQRYTSIELACRSVKMGRDTLKKACEAGTQAKGYGWTFVDTE